MGDHELLTQVEGVGPKRANNLLVYFGDGRAVANSACSGWGEITKVEGFTEEGAKTLFDGMKDAEVFHDLRGY